MDQKALGARLKQYRKSRKLSQEDVSTKLGIKRSNLSAYETGRNKIDLDTLQKLCALYGVNVQDVWKESYWFSQSPIDIEQIQHEPIVLSSEKQPMEFVHHSRESLSDTTQRIMVVRALGPYLGDKFRQQFPALSEAEQIDFFDDIRLLWEIRYAKLQKSSSSSDLTQE